MGEFFALMNSSTRSSEFSLTKKESAFGEQNLQGRRSFPGDSREEELDNTLLKEWCLN